MRVALLEAIVSTSGRHRSGLRSTRCIRYTKLFWIDAGTSTTSPRGTRARVRAEGRLRRRVRVGAANRRGGLPLAAGETHLTICSARLHRPFLNREVRGGDGDEQDAAATAATSSTASANNLYVGVTMKDLEGFEERYRAQLAPGRSASGGLVEEVYRDRRPLRAPDRARSSATSRRRSRSPPTPTAACAARAGRVLSHRRDGGPRGATTSRGSRTSESTGGHDQRLHRGLHGRARRQGRVGGAGLSTSTDEKTAAIRALADRRAVVRGPHAVGSAVPQAGACTGVTASAIEVVVETGDSGPMTPIGINLPERSGDPRDARQQVGVAVERHRGVRQVDAARRSAASSRGRRTKPERARDVGRLRTGADDEHARGDRPRLRAGSPSSCMATPQKALKEQCSAIEEARADLVALYFVRRSEARRASGWSAADDHARRSSARNTRPTRATR